MSDIEKIARGLSREAKIAVLRGNKCSVELANARLAQWGQGLTTLGQQVRAYLEQHP
jgi:hypothetical protein